VVQGRVAKQRVNLVLDDELIRALHDAATTECESMSLIVRTALRNHLRKTKAAN
jgi:metal-responsive CopG/Arc/MetJ family transcriptional regulator